MIYRLSFRDESMLAGGPALGGRLQQRIGGVITRRGLAAQNALAGEPRVTFLLHGFNVDRDRGTQQLTVFAQALDLLFPPGAPNGALVATIWPGDHWIGPLSYPFEGTDADDTAHQFARFVEDNLSTATPLSFIAHSLGARVTLETVKRLSGFNVEEICLLAPAVDSTCLADLNLYKAAVERVRRVTVLHSLADRVLRWAYPAGDLLQAFLHFTRDEPGSALGRHGPKPLRRSPLPGNVAGKPVGEHSVDHSDYLPGAGTPPNPSKPYSAAVFSAEAVNGVALPAYPPPG